MLQPETEGSQSLPLFYFLDCVADPIIYIFRDRTLSMLESGMDEFYWGHEIF